MANNQNTRPVGALQSDTEPNPKAQANAVTLRNGRELEEVPQKKKYTTSPEGELVPKPVEENKKENKGSDPEIMTRPPPLFPQRLQKEKDDAMYKKFLDILIQEVPKYARYLRDIVANKRRHIEFEIIALTEECSARVQSKLPPKLKDLRCFTILLSLGKQEVGRALCDLGQDLICNKWFCWLVNWSHFLHEMAWIGTRQNSPVTSGSKIEERVESEEEKDVEIETASEMKVFYKLSQTQVINLSRVLRPTTITLQLADRSLVMPEGIIEDVLVRVGNFILPADFIVLDFEADEEVPSILGRPFLATGGALIDVREVKLKMRVGDEEITFNLYKTLKLPKHYEGLCMITVVKLKGIEQSP
ncbi:uncharacterized protein [Nicotiana tomentosiformis]|uniref:uncharacterized protein n=1 Tax=Nicotiana tomentosiformis TaxID=4098 RepID=UPI00388CBC06